MNDKPLISVVLGSYNRLKFLKLAIESTRKELSDVPSEIIVIDGGSDSSIEFAYQQLRRRIKEFSNE